MKQDGLLSFNLQFKTHELSSLDLPIEIRKPNMVLVAHTVSSRPVHVPPGNYFVTATLPAGQELSKYVSVNEGDKNTVELSPEIEDQSPRESAELYHFLVEKESLQTITQFKANLRTAFKGDKTQFRVRIFEGNIFSNMTEANYLLAPPFEENGVIKIEVQGMDTPLMIQLLQSNKTPLNIAIPASQNLNCTLLLTPKKDDLLFNVQLSHNVANLLLHYSENGMFEQLAVASESPELDAEQLLADKRKDPIAACVGAYTLLRLNNLNRLHDKWTNNLCKWEPWLPDGAVIRGEHLARLGKHEEAFNTFLLVADRGLPLFGGGVDLFVQ